MAVNITRSKEGRDALLKGVNKLADAVKITYGAAGRNVVIETAGVPHITKDGVTVARSINLPDPIENMGASLVREASQKTVEMAGDGTSLASLLAQNLMVMGVKAVDEGANPVELKKGMDAACKEVVEKVKKFARPVDNNEILKQIATVSSNNDAEIGKLIAEAYEKIGHDGVVTVEQAQKGESEVDVVEGMQLDGGFFTPVFVTNPTKGTAELDNCVVLIADCKINKIEDLVPVMQIAHEKNKSLVVIAGEVEGTALAGLGLNKIQRGFRCVAVKAPGLGLVRKDYLQDVAVLTGGTLFSEEIGVKLSELPEAMLGKCSRVVVNKEYCQIIGGAGGKEAIETRCTELRGQLELPEVRESEYRKWNVQKRIAKMKSGVAIMRVGGFTEAEVKEKKDRVDDALCATRAAIEEGFVAGGGSTLALCYENVATTSDFNKGRDVVYKCLREPYSQILMNGAIDVVYPSKYGEGINAKTGDFVNMFQAGIIDPAKVVRVALENAVSAAGIFLTTECVISNQR